MKTLKKIVLACCLAFGVYAADTFVFRPISQHPSAGVVGTNDCLILNVWAGGSNYTTAKVTASVLWSNIYTAIRGTNTALLYQMNDYATNMTAIWSNAVNSLAYDLQVESSNRMILGYSVDTNAASILSTGAVLNLTTSNLQYSIASTGAVLAAAIEAGTNGWATNGFGFNVYSGPGYTLDWGEWWTNTTGRRVMGVASVHLLFNQAIAATFWFDGPMGREAEYQVWGPSVLGKYSHYPMCYTLGPGERGRIVLSNSVHYIDTLHAVPAVPPNAGVIGLIETNFWKGM